MTDYSDWRVWAWDGSRYRRIVKLVEGHVEIRDEKDRVHLVHSFTVVILEAAA